MNLTQIASALRAIADALEDDTGPVPEVLTAPPPVAMTPAQAPPSVPPATPPAFAMFQNQAPLPEVEVPQYPDVTVQDILTAFQELSQKKGQTVANSTMVGLLQSLGISKIGEATAGQRGTVHYALRSAVNA